MPSTAHSWAVTCPSADAIVVLAELANEARSGIVAVVMLTAVADRFEIDN